MPAVGVAHLGRSAKAKAKYIMMNARKWIPWGVAFAFGVALFHQVQQRKALEAAIAGLEREQQSLRALFESKQKVQSPAEPTDVVSRREQLPADTKSAASDTMPARVRELRDFLSRVPDQSIPELILATEGDWYTAVAGDGSLESMDDFRRALARLRGLAEMRFAVKARTALQAYLSANGGAFPKDTAALASYFEGGMASNILTRYKVVPASELPNLRLGSDWIITQTHVVDSDFDSRIVIGPNGAGTRGPSKRKPKE